MIRERFTVSALLRALLLTALGVVVALPATAQGASHYLVVFKAPTGADGVAGRVVAEHGGTLVRDLPQIGVTLATSSDPGFAASLVAEPSVLDVVPDAFFSAGDVIPTVVGEVELPASGALRAASLTTDPTQASFFDRFQWNLRKLRAPEVWATGQLGDPNVTVALVDSGIDYTHQELVGKVDLSRSVSFVPEDDALLASQFPGAHPAADLWFHGTYMADLIACNAVGTACVAPNVTLIAVKVLNFRGEGTIGRIASGVVYAADLGADVINLSFHVLRSLHVRADKDDIIVLRRAINYAHERGSAVIGEAGLALDAGNADEDLSDVVLPGQAGTLTASATDRNDELSNITDFGRTLVDVAAPAGRFTGSALDAVISACSTFSQSLPSCQRHTPDAPFHYVFLTGFPATAPTTSGVAALVDSAAGGALRGVQIESILKETAVDVGPPGFDAGTGHGRIDAFAAVFH